MVQPGTPSDRQITAATPSLQASRTQFDPTSSRAAQVPAQRAAHDLSGRDALHPGSLLDRLAQVGIEPDGQRLRWRGAHRLLCVVVSMRE